MAVSVPFNVTAGILAGIPVADSFDWARIIVAGNELATLDANAE
jgi:hypothetical protein